MGIQITKDANSDYEIWYDYREPREPMYHIYHLGKLVESFDTRSEAEIFIEETTGKPFEED